MNPLDLIKRLRQSDDTTKRRWLIILSVITMLLVLVVWTKYFAASLVRPDQRPAEDQGFSFWETMGTGLRVVGGRAADFLRGVGGWLSSSKSYIIQPSH